MEPAALDKIVKDLPHQYDENLLVGMDTADDACVYRVSEEVALIQTADFFPPMVDDPYLFGQIAAANAFSDVYAMGGVPRMALNLLCVNSCLGDEVVHEILRGGAEQAIKAGCIISGGHTIEDPVPKYGLSVTGFVHPDKIIRNIGLQPGDRLILTKPLGNGILLTALKGDLLSTEESQLLFTNMTTLNQKAAEVMQNFSVHACTDITGFGLLGHLYEMAQGSDVTVTVMAETLPMLPRTWEMAKSGLIPAAAYHNYEYIKDFVKVGEQVETAWLDIACDPQTSGGLCIAVPECEAVSFVQALKEQGIKGYDVGVVKKKHTNLIEMHETSAGW